mmetsp:Transcript_54996/g.128649  ORF Transcript_54996/g.128649 Transcript_54996/m.128649 type:complete len:255 (-) Transcript_54996:2-766(-)
MASIARRTAEDIAIMVLHEVLMSSSFCRMSRSVFFTSSCTSLPRLTPEGSSMLCAVLSLETSETRMGVSSPSRSRKAFVKEAAVICTRPSSLEKILRSCWKELWRRRSSPASRLGYNSFRNFTPSSAACSFPKFVRLPPHFTTTSSSVQCPFSPAGASVFSGFGITKEFSRSKFSSPSIEPAAVSTPAAPSSPSGGSSSSIFHLRGFTCTLRLMPLKLPFSSTARICCSFASFSSVSRMYSSLSSSDSKTFRLL